MSYFFPEPELARLQKDYLNTQCLVKSAASLADQSPLGFSFMFSHQRSLPTSAQALQRRIAAARSTFLIIVLSPEYQ
jgi:hypothetical protein